MFNKYLILPFLILSGLSISCTSTPKASDYPKRYIDQPYTLPEGIDIWGSVGGVFYEKSNGKEYSWPLPVPIPLYWEHSLNENLTLEIPALPIGLRWKITSDSTSEMGLHISWGFGYGTSSGLSLFPSASMFYKILIDKDHAFTLSPHIGYSYYGRNTEKNYFNEALTFGYLIQLNDANAIQPRIILSSSDYNKKVYIPLELFYSYRMSQTWQFESTYNYSGIGYEDYFGHFFSFIFKQYF
jgi:hypothetical protein